MTEMFTKTEAKARLRKTIQEAKRYGGLPINYRTEVGLRVKPVAAPSVEEARAAQWPEDDDLADMVDRDGALNYDEVRAHGAVVHIYLYAPESRWGGGELIDVNTVWMGTPDADPCLLTYNGRDVA